MIDVFNNITIADRNSFRIDVVARQLIEYTSSDDLRQIFSSPESRPREWRVLSGGNNILFTGDVAITLLTPTDTSIEIIAEDDSSTTLRIAAGAEWDDVVEWAVARNLWGIENLSLIPGKAGAAPIQNIGAYGVEVCDLIERVEYFDTTTQQLQVLCGDECQFGYRESIFKGVLRSSAIVTAIEIKLSKIATPRLNYADVAARVEQRGGATLRNIREVIIEIRREKLPDTATLPNAGSFFKNPIVSRECAEKLRESYPTIPIYDLANNPTHCKLAAGWLIDKAGMKGYREGSVGVHERQALVLVNYGGANGTDVIELAERVKERVNEIFAVEIECEVNIL